MNISREEQKEFARAALSILDHDSSPDVISSLNKTVSLLVSWVGEENSIAVNLSEYIGELNHIAQDGKDSGWKDEFKRILEADLGI
ncbi:hypothetical protein [Microbacterium sp. NPDC076895]|uniref:hypothetical protein n=1 Tax=Microbacterium sp. NPDC076895 TaxID=3154957 RepID=UPI003415A9D6